MKKLVSKLNSLMELKEISCYELSKKTGIANTTLDTLLKGKTDKFDIIKLQKICKVLGCSLEYLMNDDVTYYVPENEKGYYVSEEAARYGQEIANNSDLKMLFDAAKGIKKEDMQLVYEMVKRFRDNAN